MLRDFAVAAYSIVGLGLAAQGLRYLVASQYMHYHADVVQEHWSDLKPSEQRLMLGLLKGFGAGMLCLGLTLAFVALGPLRDGAYMAHWFLAVSAIGSDQAGDCRRNRQAAHGRGHQNRRRVGRFSARPRFRDNVDSMSVPAAFQVA